nr:Rep [Cressdnaviricota sp.]
MHNECFVFSVTWFAGLDSQPTIHKAFTRIAKKFVYQLERAPTTGNLHFQCYVSLRKKTRSGKLGKTLSSLGVKGATCLPASDNGKEALSLYAMKTDTREAGPWGDRPIYMGQDLPKSFLPWQQECKDIIDSPPSKRSIHWFTDQNGGAGKSTFAKMMYFRHNVLTLTFGDAKDLLNLVFKKQGLRTYMFDLSRTKGGKTSMSDIYQALESVKNGYFINTKYETGVACYAIPHVIVFSNHAPDMSALSLDRWQIHTM